MSLYASTPPQIDEQLYALRETPQLQTMVALYIFAGLRREEALWLTVDDVQLGHFRSRRTTTTTTRISPSVPPPIQI